MDEDGDEDYPRSPFWLQSTTNIRRADRYRRRASSIFFNLGSLVLILLVAATLFLVFVIPSIFRHYTTSTATSQNVKPSLVKRSWDWINLVLVLFALAFGFLSRNRNEDRDYDGYRRTGSMTSSNGAPKSNPSTPHQPWFDFPDQTVGGLRRGRNSSSYPDLRELSAPGGGGSDPWRFSDDTHLNSYRVWDSDHPYRRRSWKELERQNSVTKDVIHVDNLVNLPTEVSHAPPPRVASPPRPPPPPPPPQPAVTSSAPPAAKRKTNRTYQSLGHESLQQSASPPPPQPPVTSSAPRAAKRKTKRTYQSVEHDQETMGGKGHSYSEPTEIVAEEPEEQPLSPPPVMASIQEMEQRSSRSDRKRSGGNATKDFLASLYSKKKKKRQRQRSGDNLDALLHHPQPPLRYQLPPPSPPPPPPPLPPPPSVFHNLFNKKDKRRKIPPPATYSYTAPPPPLPPPPPPPPPAARAPRPTTRKPPVTSPKPPMPARVHNFNNNNIDDGSSGGESPMRRIPPPPPPPPFRVPDLKYVVEGDYARLLSTDSSRSGSPEPEEVESPISEAGDVTASPLFCTSPDVDTKADSFIAKVRAGMKLEKLNSFNQKQQQGLRMSNLGPNPGGSSN